MNKLLFSLFFLTSIISLSQNFNGGWFAGISTTQVSGDELSGFNKIGPCIGLYINHNIKWYQIQLELRYITKGSKKVIDNTNQNDITFNYNLHLDYVGIPILLSTYIRENTKIELGTEINFLIRQKEEIDFYEDNSRKVSRLETCMLIGLTYEINDEFSLNTRLSNSITPIRPHSSGETYYFNKGQYNTALSFSLYYYLKD